MYLDDILVFSKTAEDHEKHLRAVLKLLRENKFHAKLWKCHFMKEEVEYLGHLVGKDGIRVDPRKVQVVKDWPTPKDVHQVRSFLGLANYFRKFIRGYASIVVPLTALTRKTQPFIWDERCEFAFQRVKELLVSAPVLRLPDPDLPYEVVCDASLVGLGAVLL